jgi:hypothetical protein
MSASQDGAFAGLMSAFPAAVRIVNYNPAGVRSDEGIDRYLRPIVADPTGNEIGDPATQENRNELDRPRNCGKLQDSRAP